jgi:hypothetical protein
MAGFPAPAIAAAPLISMARARHASVTRLRRRVKMPAKVCPSLIDLDSFYIAQLLIIPVTILDATPMLSAFALIARLAAIQ